MSQELALSQLEEAEAKRRVRIHCQPLPSRAPRRKGTMLVSLKKKKKCKEVFLILQTTREFIWFRFIGFQSLIHRLGNKAHSQSSLTGNKRTGNKNISCSATGHWRPPPEARMTGNLATPPAMEMTQNPKPIYLFLLEYNCFTMLCYFLLYNNMNQLYKYRCPLPLEPPSHTTGPPLQVRIIF